MKFSEIIARVCPGVFTHPGPKADAGLVGFEGIYEARLPHQGFNTRRVRNAKEARRPLSFSALWSPDPAAIHFTGGMSMSVSLMRLKVLVKMVSAIVSEISASCTSL